MFLEKEPSCVTGPSLPTATLQPPATAFAESLSGLIERVTFHNEENGFAARVVRARRTDLERVQPVAPTPHSPPAPQPPAPEAIPIPTKNLPFAVLPAGTWDIEDVIQYYQQHRTNLPSGLAPDSLELDRIRKIESLGPAECWVGKETWLGYVVFTFAGTERVVLECPFKGNATYIIHDNWKQKVMHTKLWFRENQKGQYTKIVHLGYRWLLRVKNALER